MGFIRPVIVDSEFELLPENAVPYYFFLEIQHGYWLQGFSGISGLDHAAVIERIRLFFKKPKQQRWILQCIESIERGYLWAINDEWHENSKENPPTALERKEIENRRQWRC